MVIDAKKVQLWKIVVEEAASILTSSEYVTPVYVPSETVVTALTVVVEATAVNNRNAAIRGAPDTVVRGDLHALCCSAHAIRRLAPTPKNGVQKKWRALGKLAVK